MMWHRVAPAGVLALAVTVSLPAAPALAVDRKITDSSRDLYYAGLALDGAGDLMASMTYSSPTDFPSLGAVGRG